MSKYTARTFKDRNTNFFFKDIGATFLASCYDGRVEVCFGLGFDDVTILFKENDIITNIPSLIKAVYNSGVDDGIFQGKSDAKSIFHTLIEKAFETE